MNYTRLVDFVKAALSLMEDRWRGLYQQGWDMRMSNEPFMWHGRRTRGPVLLGWNNADKHLRGKKFARRRWMPVIPTEEND